MRWHPCASATAKRRAPPSSASPADPTPRDRGNVRARRRRAREFTMSTTSGHQVAPLKTPQAARWTLLILTLIAFVLLALIVKPFAGALFVAAVMAGAIYPWYSRLARKM